jgi:hypothetical protein
VSPLNNLFLGSGPPLYQYTAHGSSNQYAICLLLLLLLFSFKGRTGRESQRRCRPFPRRCGASTTHGKSDSLIIWIRDVFCSRKPSTFVCRGQNTSRIQHVPNVTLAPWPARIVSLGWSSWSSSHGIASAARDASAAEGRTTGTRALVQSKPPVPVFVMSALIPPQLHDSIRMLHGCAMIAKQVLLLGCVGDWRWRSGGHRCLLFSFAIQHVHQCAQSA